MPAKFPEIVIPPPQDEPETFATRRGSVTSSQQYLSNVSNQNSTNEFSRQSNRDDIVISGISGKLPESDNIQEFADNLFNGVDMITGKLFILFLCRACCWFQ